jgi:spore germination cell wall hydrolase CwlJ-like protein
MRVARRALGREKIDVVGDSSFYHVCSMNRLPHWVPHVEFVKSVGNHCFYRGDGKARGVDI